MIYCDDAQNLDPNTWVNVWSIEFDGRAEFYCICRFWEIDIGDYAVQPIDENGEPIKIEEPICNVLPCLDKALTLRIAGKIKNGTRANPDATYLLN